MIFLNCIIGKKTFFFSRGSQNSIMFYEEATAKWIVQSLRNPERFVRTSNRLPEDLPIGNNL